MVTGQGGLVVSGGGMEVPEALALVGAFADTADVEEVRDDLDSVEHFAGWLARHGYAGIEPTDSELATAVSVRDAIRDELAAHHDGGSDPGARARLDEVASRLPMRAVLGDGAARFVPVGGGVQGLLGAVLAAMVLSVRDGTWQRLKLCRKDDCAVVFYDQSKNRSRTWCSMGVCGNRTKTQAYRDRLSEGASSSRRARR